MSPVKPRKISRREQADASRHKVLAAARDAFIDSGYHGATMSDIARRAGLAVQTVSYFFGTKPKLMSQLLTTSVREAAPVGQAEWEQGMAAAEDAAALLDSVVEIGHQIMHQVSPLMDVARIGGLTDPEVEEVYRFHEDWRRADFARFVADLDRLHGLRPGLTVATATDVVLTVFGPESYLSFSVRCGWSGDQIKAWMHDALRRLLLP
ncbi:TetR/AcrR family transcriptional regulator [Granulicoccus sp. GXG6511]|uniref:TetR/AcrR family transcriptional regulator n=1 Tax=Granulicoccus sp. GXG6511 TaxID=3381351 RepID=UPI003D7E99E6